MSTNNSFQLTTPVCFCIFNRPDTTKQVFEKIREAKPQKLYLVSDAPRKNKPGEEELVKETRGYVEEHIDWECEVYKNYAEENMGCKKRMASGITWVFEQEETAIILEDDCVPAKDFFEYVQTMLVKYKDNPKVMMVSGTNLVRKVKIEGDYTFSRFPVIWGWATWKRAWDLYDVDMPQWPEVEKTGVLKKYYNPLAYKFFCRDANKIYNGLVDTWDLQWDFTRQINAGIGIVPKENLIDNIGFNRADATHTVGHSFEDFSTGSVNFPIHFINQVEANQKYDSAYLHKNMGVRKIYNYIRKKIKK